MFIIKNMKYINVILMFLFINNAALSQKIITLDGGTKVIKGSPNDINGYFDFFIDTANTLGYDLSPLRNQIISIRYLSVNEEIPDFNNYHDKNSFFAIAFAIGMNQDNKVEIVVDYEQWLKLNDFQKMLTMFHELCHDLLNIEHDDSKENNLMHSSIGPSSIEELIFDFDSLLKKYAYMYKKSVWFGDNVNEFVRLNPLGGEIKKDLNNNLIAGESPNGIPWIAYFDNNKLFKSLVIINGVYSLDDWKKYYIQNKEKLTSMFGHSPTNKENYDSWITSWELRDQSIDYYSQTSENVMVVLTRFSGKHGTPFFKNN